MALNEKKISILQAIAAGSTTGVTISATVGSSTQLLNYYLDTMAQDDYIQVAKLFDNATQEFQVVRAYLTDKGQTSLQEHLDRLALVAPVVPPVVADDSQPIAALPPTVVELSR
jgi:DeoR family transcriptional regulator, catabolite repression regulator